MKKLILSLIAILSSQAALAGLGSQSFIYHGSAYSLGGTAPVTSKVDIQFDILSLNGCLLYEEKQTGLDLGLTGGKISTPVGSAIGAAARTASDPGLSMSDIFLNGKVIPVSTKCPSGYTGVSGDSRILHVSIAVTTGGTLVALSPDLPLGSVPTAFSADTLQGLKPSDLMTPAGTVISYAGLGCPTGYLLADGSSYLISLYSSLSTSLLNGANYLYGSADATHFSVPNLNGMFLRGSGYQGYGGVGYNGGNVADKNTDMFQQHGWTITVPSTNAGGSGVGSPFGGTNGSLQAYQTWNMNVYNNGGGNIRWGGETRPVSSTVNYCIKY